MALRRWYHNRPCVLPFSCSTGVSLPGAGTEVPRLFRVPPLSSDTNPLCVISGYLLYSSIAYTGIGAPVGVGRAMQRCCCGGVAVGNCDQNIDKKQDLI